MGFALFTQSGTFNPSSYGLSVGDVVHVKAVGGGGGGCGSYYNGSYVAGTAGDASSFGSVLTADGGLGASNSDKPSAAQYSQIGARCGGLGVISFSYMSFYGSSGGAGADGWAPGMQEYFSGITAAIFVPYVISNVTTSGITATAAIPSTSLIYRGREFAYRLSTWAGSTAPTTTPYSRAGGISRYTSQDASQYCVTCGGVGYGAGGGGGASTQYDGFSHSNRTGCGGNGGVIEDTEHTITTAAGIAVTVGAGGAGGSQSACGGGGARGCVAIWW